MTIASTQRLLSIQIGAGAGIGSPTTACELGEVATGGGYNVRRGFEGKTPVHGESRVESGGRQGWQVFAADNGPDTFIRAVSVIGINS